MKTAPRTLPSPHAMQTTRETTPHAPRKITLPTIARAFRYKVTPYRQGLPSAPYRKTIRHDLPSSPSMRLRPYPLPLALPTLAGAHKFTHCKR